MEDVSINPYSSNFSFCFNGVQIFFNVSTPHHKVLKNRNLGHYIVFIVNPRENFDFVAPNNSEKGVKTRKLIRNRVLSYNNEVIPSELGFFSDSNNFEWKQYTLPEPNVENLKECPFKVKK